MNVFPLALAYLERLADGVASYPQCTAKAFPLTIALKERPFRGPRSALDGLPPDAAALFDRSYRPDETMGEVAFRAALFVLADLQGMTADAYVDWTRRLNRELIDSRVYHLIFLLASPAQLIRGAATRYRALHQGQQIVAEMTGAKEARVSLHYPACLLNELVVRGLMTSLEVALAKSRAKSPRITLVDITDVSTSILARWD